MRRTPLKRTPFKSRPSRKEGIPKSTREFVLRRDGGCVMREGSYGDHECWGGVHIHHKLPRSRGGPHTNENLVCLCAIGHQYVHGNPAWARDMGLLR